MAQGVVVQTAGFGGKEFGLQYYGTALVIQDSVDLAVVRLCEQGAAAATRVTSLSIAATFPVTAPTATSNYFLRWAIVSGVDVAALYQNVFATAGPTNALFPRNAPWGGMAEYGTSTVSASLTGAPILPPTAIVHAIGVVAAAALSGVAAYAYDDNDAIDVGGPGSIVIPRGTVGQLLIIPPIPYPSTTTSISSAVGLTVRGGTVQAPLRGPADSGLPSAAYSTRN